MRFRIPLNLLGLAGLAGASVVNDASYLLTTREILVRPPAAAEAAFLETKIEPTKYELRLLDAAAAERWEQGFFLAARLPVHETLSIRQEFRTGLQSETVLGQELSSTYRDALAVLEKTSAELQASEALRLAVTAQQQWVFNNRVPFTEITTYGTEAVLKPTSRVALKLQAEWQGRAELEIRAEETRQNYRLVLEHEAIPKRLGSALGVGAAEFETMQGTTRAEHKADAALWWSPDGATASLTVGGEWIERDTEGPGGSPKEFNHGTNSRFTLTQRFAGRSKIELQAAHEWRLLDAPSGALAGNVWSLGASTDMALRETWNAGISLKYRIGDLPAQPVTLDEVSFSLSLKAQF